MSTIVDDLNTLTTKVAALRTKVKAKAVASDATVADTDTISQIVDKIVSFSRIKLTNSYKYVDSLNNYISNICDFSNITDMSRMFKNCSELTSIPLFDTSRANIMNEFFYGCAGLTKVTQIDVQSATNMMYIFYKCPALSYIKILNFGKQSDVNVQYAFVGTIWGQGSDEARQSLVDSLLTNSFNRVTARYAPLTVKLPSASLDLLKGEELMAIIEKGYTLTA